MAYTLDFALNLGPSHGGLTDLRAQLVDTAGASTGAAVATGFHEIGTASGIYLWHYAALPDGHRGAVYFYSLAAAATILTAAAINPQEGENLDAKVSTASTLTAGQVETAVWDAPTTSHRVSGSFGLQGQGILRDGTATAGAAATITLDAGASTTVDLYKGAAVYLYSGTGADQSARMVTAYSAGRVATVAPAWTVIPDATSKFILFSTSQPLPVGSDARVLISADSHTAGATVAGVTGLAASDVHTQVANALTVDTIAELAQGIPPVTPTVVQALALMYMALRNQMTDDGSTLRVFNDAGVCIAKGTTGDSGAIFTRGRLQSGP